MKIKKLFLILMLFVTINLCCWEMRTVVNEISGGVPGLFIPVVDAYIVESEASDLFSTSDTHWDVPSVGVIKYLNGTEQIGIHWGNYIESSSGTLKVQFDEKPSCGVYCRPGLKAAVIEDESAVYSLIQDFKCSNKVIFQTKDDRGHFYNVKISLRGFTKAYEIMQSEWRKR